MSTLAQVIRDGMAADARMGHGTNIGALKATSLNVGASGSEVAITATPDELNQVDGAIFNVMTPGTGISPVTNSSYAASVTKIGSLFKTEILIDLTGLNGGGHAGDIIGKDGEPNCHLGQITAAKNGTIFAGEMRCLEAPAGSNTDVDLNTSTVATGAEDAAVPATSALLLNAGAWSVNTFKTLDAFPAANTYLYLTSGAATDATFTAGIFVITLWGK